jgi:HSP90 family molecular chaperone
MLTSGILHRFGHDLHTDPSVVFAALVARSHAACLERAAADRSYVPAILVTTQSSSGRVHLSVCDNGAPLPAEDVKQLYAAIRTGRVGSLRRALTSTDHATAMVGKVGVALLAAFVLADQVGIVTRGQDEGIRYLCNSRTYVAEPYAAPRPGTTFQLRMRAEATALSDIANVRAALVTSLGTRSVTTPIRVGSDTRPINSESCPRS